MKKRNLLPFIQQLLVWPLDVAWAQMYCQYTQTIAILPNINGNSFFQYYDDNYNQTVTVTIPVTTGVQQAINYVFCPDICCKNVVNATQSNACCTQTKLNTIIIWPFFLIPAVFILVLLLREKLFVKSARNRSSCFGRFSRERRNASRQQLNSISMRLDDAAAATRVTSPQSAAAAAVNMVPSIEMTTTLDDDEINRNININKLYLPPDYNDLVKINTEIEKDHSSSKRSVLSNNKPTAVVNNGGSDESAGSSNFEISQASLSSSSPPKVQEDDILPNYNQIYLPHDHEESQLAAAVTGEETAPSQVDVQIQIDNTQTSSFSSNIDENNNNNNNNEIISNDADDNKETVINDDTANTSATLELSQQQSSAAVNVKDDDEDGCERR